MLSMLCVGFWVLLEVQVLAVKFIPKIWKCLTPYSNPLFHLSLFYNDLPENQFLWEFWSSKLWNLGMISYASREKIKISFETNPQHFIWSLHLYRVTPQPQQRLSSPACWRDRNVWKEIYLCWKWNKSGYMLLFTWFWNNSVIFLCIWHNLKGSKTFFFISYIQGVVTVSCLYTDSMKRWRKFM